MDYPKSVPNVGLVNGKFVDENTATGQVGSLIPSVWGNSVTDELLNVIRNGGFTPEESNSGQLLAAIMKIVSNAIPSSHTTLAGYGITDAYTKQQVDTSLSSKAAKANTLSGYGITDAYTKSQTDSALDAKAAKANTLAGYGIGDAFTKAEVNSLFNAGFGLLLGENGFLAFPTVLGRFVIQWGSTTAGNVTFPIQFRGVSHLDLKINNFNSTYAASGAYTNNEALSTTGFTVTSAPPAGARLKWIAFGN
ncbi:hypothetical protein ACMGG8_28355 [Pseudomonas sp. BNK-45]|uniref:hypothetical protein n=1 Tax=Pseudomonas sp. BNK-45 TaxID=3376180 RepID=UPI0039BF5B07